MSQARSRYFLLPTYLAIGWLLFIAILGVVAPALPLPYPPGVPDLLHMAEAPAWAARSPHWLGTDPLGRDVLAELVYGARQVVNSSLPAAVLATLVGALLGGAAGFWGDKGLRLSLAAWLVGLAAVWWVAALPGRTFVVGALVSSALVAWWGQKRGFISSQLNQPFPLDGGFKVMLTLLGAVPRLVLVLTLAAGPPLGTLGFMLLLAIVSWPEPARLVRAQMLRVRELPFIEAVRAAGVPDYQLWLRHALPHACQPLRTMAPLSLAALIGLESTLAFLGVGRPPDMPSWGHLLGTLRQEPGAWWLLASAGGALLLTMFALQQLARQLSNPR